MARSTTSRCHKNVICNNLNLEMKEHEKQEHQRGLKTFGGPLADIDLGFS